MNLLQENLTQGGKRHTGQQNNNKIFVTKHLSNTNSQQTEKLKTRNYIIQNSMASTRTFGVSALALFGPREPPRNRQIRQKYVQTEVFLQRKDTIRECKAR